MEPFKKYEPEPRTLLQVQQDRIETASGVQETANAYRRGAGSEEEGPRREAMARYAVGYQYVADAHLKLSAIAPADNLTEPPIPRSEVIS